MRFDIQACGDITDRNKAAVDDSRSVKGSGGRGGGWGVIWRSLGNLLGFLSNNKKNHYDVDQPYQHLNMEQDRANVHLTQVSFYVSSSAALFLLGLVYVAQ